MAQNLVATVLQNYISDYQGRLDKFEQRPSIYGALEMAKMQTNDPLSILDAPTKAAIDARFNTSVQVPVIDYKNVSVSNVRTCALQTGGLTSHLVTLTAVTLSVGFIMYPQQYYENYIAYQQAMNKQIEAAMQALALTLDTGIVNTLAANVNQYYPTAITNYYPVIANALQVPQAEKNDFYNQYASIMETMDFPGNIDVTTNFAGISPVRRLSNQGAGNAVNEAFQFGGYQWFGTNRVTNGATGIESTFYGVAPGSIALHSRIDPDSKARKVIHQSKYWDVFPNAPYIGQDLGVYFQADCTDASAIQASGMANSTNTSYESWQFSVDEFYIAPYNSSPTTRFNPIVKAEILS